VDDLSFPWFTKLPVYVENFRVPVGVHAMTSPSTPRAFRAQLFILFSDAYFFFIEIFIIAI